MDHSNCYLARNLTSSLKRKTGKIMSKPEHVSPANLDDAVKAGVERAEQANELTQDDLDSAAGGISPPGRIDMSPYAEPDAM
jgi:hypothetical protein